MLEVNRILIQLWHLGLANREASTTDSGSTMIGLANGWTSTTDSGSTSIGSTICGSSQIIGHHQLSWFWLVPQNVSLYTNCGSFHKKWKFVRKSIKGKENRIKSVH